MGVDVDSQDRVYLLARGDARVLVYDRKGNFLASWGEDIFSQQTHGITIGPDDCVYIVDDGGHVVRKFAPDGTPLLVLGTPGMPSDTGYDSKRGLPSIRCSGPPFNRPTNLAVNAAMSVSSRTNWPKAARVCSASYRRR